jgi:ketosteroid isomerase-like protein
MKKLVFVLPLILCTGLAAAAPADLGKSFDALVETERAFAQTSVDKGLREAFSRYLASDSVVMRPTPEGGQKWLNGIPATMPVQVSWEPRHAVLSHDGSFGWVIGPWKVHRLETNELMYGHFLTVWRRQSDGSWRVAADTAIMSPGPDPAPAAGPIALTTPALDRPEADAVSSRKALLEVDLKLTGSAAKSDPAEYLSFLSEDTRFLRMRSYPVQGKEAIRAALAQSWTPLRWRQIGGEMSSAGDMGYTYGTLEDPAGQGRTESAYMRLWERRPDGSWTVVVDLVNWLPQTHAPVAAPKNPS